jgi:uncharacterized protein YbjT (DUF2867 family)
MTARSVFITGGTGYLGRRLIDELLKRGHHVRALVRKGSAARLPKNCEAITGNALDKNSFVKKVLPSDTFVQLVGVPRPSPAKAKQFREIDLVSVQAAVAAAVEAGITHFVYVSVAQPAPVMKAYIEVRAEGERLIREAGLNATILRPWYVLGPGHRWPYVLLPLYWIMERLPSTRESAQRLGFVTHEQMVNALVASVDHPSDDGVKILSVPQIRQFNQGAAPASSASALS